MDMDKLVALCRRRGFIFQSSEIYGGINGFWDYGPLGVELKKNIKDVWWHDMVRNPPPGPDGQEIQMVGVDCALIMNPKVWEASGHVGGFADPMVDCKKCRRRYRADKVIFAGLAAEGQPVSVVLAVEADDRTEAGRRLEAEQQRLVKKKKIPAGLSATLRTAHEAPAEWNRPCPAPGCEGQLTEPRSFNLMFKTFVGALEDAASAAYLRPETAQGIFVNFRNVLDSTRLKLPFGIAQVGKAFRNEINPRNYTFRSREFEQMEIEFFCHPDESMKWYQYWRDVRIRWYTQLGIKSDRLRPREQAPEERAHYSIGTTDIEYLFPFSEEPQELEGVAHRSDYDLKQHGKFSGKDLSYFDEQAWDRDKDKFPDPKAAQQAKAGPPYRFLPHVIEPSAGADRFTLAVLCEAYAEDEVGGEKRTVMRFHPRLAPIKAAVFPLVNKDGMPEKAHALYRQLKAEFNVFYDDKGAVGRRYRRQDEAGTPFCITIDGQTLQDDTVTVRDRDSTRQWRVPVRGVVEELRQRLRP
ncbi:MAG TPA: glycine--tRNA ligase [Gemmataceae bacterium]|jgi:glycyl-tRNA synthetase|nr:glycine--tRNA ligase [Gemmataceae bacterium]